MRSADQGQFEVEVVSWQLRWLVGLAYKQSRLQLVVVSHPCHCQVQLDFFLSKSRSEKKRGSVVPAGAGAQTRKFQFGHGGLQ